MSDIIKSEALKDRIHIADEVIASIATLAMGKISSITLSSTGVSEGLAGFLGKKSYSKGVKVEANEGGVTLEIYVTMEYGCRINEVGKRIQVAVRENVEGMTGLRVRQVNVHVLGINVKEPYREVKALKDAKDGKDAKDAKDAKDFKDIKNPKDKKDAKDPGETGDFVDARDVNGMNDINDTGEIGEIRDERSTNDAVE